MRTSRSALGAARRNFLHSFWLSFALLFLAVWPNPGAQELTSGRGVRPAVRRELLDEGFVPYGRKVALVVGIDDYSPAVGGLRYAVSDARAVEELLRRFLGFDEILVLENKEARRADILEALVTLGGSLGAQDQFLFYFAGHGVTFGDGSNEMGYLLPQDAHRRDEEAKIAVDGLSMAELSQQLVRLKAKHVLMVVDACYSGYAGVTSRGGLSPGSVGYLKAITREPARQLLTAGRRGERSLESDRWGHSAFTYKLLQGLEEHLADRDRNGIVPVLELSAYLSEAVFELTGGEQTPQFADLTPGEGEFVFVLPEPSEPQRIRLSRPASVEISGDRVEVLDRLGVALWRHTMSGKVAAGEIADLDGDGVGEVVVGLGGEGDAGRVLVFDFRGDLRWSRDPPQSSIYAGARTGRFAVTGLKAGPLLADGRNQVAVLWSDAGGWPVALVGLLDGDGKLVASYWNPGALSGLAFVRRAGDAAWRILVHGFNNDLAASYPGSGRLAVFFLLDPNAIEGEAPPYSGNTGRGRQLWYALLSPRESQVLRVEPPGLVTDSAGGCSWRLDGDSPPAGECPSGHLVLID